MLNLVLEADVAQRPLVAPHKLRRIQVTEGPPQVIRVRLVEGLLGTRRRAKNCDMAQVDFTMERPTFSPLLADGLNLRSASDFSDSRSSLNETNLLAASHKCRSDENREKR